MPPQQRSQLDGKGKGNPCNFQWQQLHLLVGGIILPYSISVGAALTKHHYRAHCLSCAEHLASQRRKGKISNWWLKTPQSRSSPTEKPAPCLVACPATPFHPSVLFKSHSSPYLAAQPERGWPQEPTQATRSSWIHPLWAGLAGQNQWAYTRDAFGSVWPIHWGIPESAATGSWSKYTEMVLHYNAFVFCCVSCCVL